MTDVYRFVLALCVVQAHLLASGPLWLAWQAVFSFYVLSGFLMTLILNEVYGFGGRNFVRFAINRVLRLFPSYYVVVAITALYIVLASPLNQLNAAMALPATLPELWSNLLILGQVGIGVNDISPHRLVPTAWSLSVELFCYVLLAIYFAVSARRLAWLLAAGLAISGGQLVWAIASAAPHYGFFDRYTVLQAGIIPFSIGGLAYFWRRSIVAALGRWGAPLAVVAVLANAAAGYLSDFHQLVLGLYVAVVLNFLLVPILFDRDQQQPKARWQSVLGGMSYPIFISHWLIGTLVFLHLDLEVGGAAHFAITLVATLIFAAAVHFGMDRPIEALRVKLKKGATGATMRLGESAAGHVGAGSATARSARDQAAGGPR